MYENFYRNIFNRSNGIKKVLNLKTVGWDVVDRWINFIFSVRFEWPNFFWCTNFWDFWIIELLKFKNLQIGLQKIFGYRANVTSCETFSKFTLLEDVVSTAKPWLQLQNGINQTKYHLKIQRFITIWKWNEGGEKQTKEVKGNIYTVPPNKRCREIKLIS